ncbi:MAG TPA: tetratricopeptide repeat protein, partial [Terriglobales bacterium]|nr:tetratricopeptide repeat protein [Terriglobales bacterium]
MDARVRLKLGVFLAVALAAAAMPASAQKGNSGVVSSGKTVRKVRVTEEDTSVAPAVIQAETAIEKRDYVAAEALLQKVVELDPRDYRAYFDLGYVFNATGRKLEAINAYKKSVAVKPTVQETNLNLGILLAAEGKNVEAARFLRAATSLKPEAKDSAGVYRAWLSLGRVLQDVAPAEAIAAYREAARMEPKDPEPHLSLARLLEKADPSASESEYRQALALDPKSQDALAGLINLYTQSERLTEAEAFLRAYLRAQPQSASANL